MDGKRLRLLLRAGIICLVGGTVGAGLTYRSMRTENLVHARTEELTVPFGDSAVSASTRFQPYAAGVHRLYLAQGPGCTEETLSRELSRLDGIIDIAVTDADGRAMLSRSIGPADAAGFPRESNGWLLLDSVMIPPTRDSAWTLEVSYRPGSPLTPICAWVVFLLPPQELEIGGFLGDRARLLLLFGGVMLTGFILIVAGGRKRQ